MSLLYFTISIVAAHSYNRSIDCYYVFRRTKTVLELSPQNFDGRRYGEVYAISPSNKF